MNDGEEVPIGTVATVPSMADRKRDMAAAIYAAWRNAHINNLPVAAFNRVEEVSEHLIAAIAAAL